MFIQKVNPIEYTEAKPIFRPADITPAANGIWISSRDEVLETVLKREVDVIVANSRLGGDLSRLDKFMLINMYIQTQMFFFLFVDYIDCLNKHESFFFWKITKLCRIRKYVLFLKKKLPYRILLGYNEICCLKEIGVTCNKRLFN